MRSGMPDVTFSLPRKGSYYIPCTRSKAYTAAEPCRGVYPENVLCMETLPLQEWLCQKCDLRLPTELEMHTINNFMLRKRWTSEWMNKWMSPSKARPGHCTTQWDHVQYQTRIGLQCHWPLSPEKRTSHRHTCPWAESGLTPTPEMEPLIFRPADQLREVIKGPS